METDLARAPAVLKQDVIASDPGGREARAGNGIIGEEALGPRRRPVGFVDLLPQERLLADEIESALDAPRIREVIGRHLRTRPRRLRVLFFEGEGDGVRGAVGLFREDGRLLDGSAPARDAGLVLGLRRDHPLVRALVASEQEHGSCRALTFVARELERARRRLAPGSPGIHGVKSGLAAELRRAVRECLLGESGQ